MIVPPYQSPPSFHIKDSERNVKPIMSALNQKQKEGVKGMFFSQVFCCILLLCLIGSQEFSLSLLNLGITLNTPPKKILGVTSSMSFNDQQIKC